MLCSVSSVPCYIQCPAVSSTSCCVQCLMLCPVPHAVSFASCCAQEECLGWVLLKSGRVHDAAQIYVKVNVQLFARLYLFRSPVMVLL